MGKRREGGREKDKGGGRHRGKEVSKGELSCLISRVPPRMSPLLAQSKNGTKMTTTRKRRNGWRRRKSRRSGRKRWDVGQSMEGEEKYKENDE